jgi:hypothetical protein
MHGSIPRSLFMTFQGMFFIITPALICGAFAERMKFGTMCVFSALMRDSAAMRDRGTMGNATTMRLDSLRRDSLHRDSVRRGLIRDTMP